MYRLVKGNTRFRSQGPRGCNIPSSSEATTMGPETSKPCTCISRQREHLTGLDYTCTNSLNSVCSTYENKRCEVLICMKMEFHQFCREKTTQSDSDYSEPIILLTSMPWLLPVAQCCILDLRTCTYVAAACT